MRALTFTGFLKKYVQDLSACNSTGVFKLTQEAVQDNPRLREPLFLYALNTNKLELLLKASRNTPLEQPYRELAQAYPLEPMLTALATKDARLPPGYLKVWRSYMAQRQKPKSDLEVKALVRKRVLEEQRRRGFSTYRLGKELGLNPGNLGAWLQGDDRKVSLPTAKAVLEKAQQL